MNNTKVKITTTQVIDEAGNEDKIELMTEAHMEFNGEYFTVDYDESEITEGESNKTRLKIYKHKLIMIKMGDYSTRMEFQKNENSANMYTTPFGSFDIKVNTLMYNNELNEEGKGSIYLEYKIIFDGGEDSVNKIKIDIY